MTATRDKLIRAAERLMAARGVDNVTFAEITKAAGQRNNSAIPYYFGDREGLIRSVLEKHRAPISERRAHLLDSLTPHSTLRDVVVTLVQPIIDQVQQCEGGADYVRILAHLVSHPDMDPEVLDTSARPVNQRLNVAFVAAAPPLPAKIYALRMQLTLLLLFHGIADHAGTLADQKRNRRASQLFVENLIDTIEAVFTAPPSTAASSLTVPRRA